MFLLGDSTCSCTYTYDALDRITGTSVNGRVLYQYTYDSRGNLKEIYAGSGTEQRFVVGYEYYRNGLKHFEYRPLGQTIEYRYDNNKNLSSVIDAKNQLISYHYDPYDQLSQVKYYSADNHDQPVNIIDMAYDDYGNMISVDDGKTRIEYTHDSRNRLLTEIMIYEKDTVDEFSKTISYTYYENGKVKSYTSHEGKTYQYTYDNNNVFYQTLCKIGN